MEIVTEPVTVPLMEGVNVTAGAAPDTVGEKLTLTLQLAPTEPDFNLNQR